MSEAAVSATFDPVRADTLLTDSFVGQLGRCRSRSWPFKLISNSTRTFINVNAEHILRYILQNKNSNEK